MKPFPRKYFAPLLTVMLAFFLSIFSVITSASAFADAPRYDVEAALEYARNHCNSDDGQLCAEFVARCLRAGGFDIGIQTFAVDVMDKAHELSGLPEVTLKLNANGYATEALDSDLLHPGDIVSVYCTDDGKTPHVILFGGFENGEARYYAHNRAKNFETVRLSPWNAYGHGSHTVEGHVIQLSKLANLGASASASSQSSGRNTTVAPRSENREIYSVYLDPMGGLILRNEVTWYAYGTCVLLPTADDMFREGYEFQGWYSSGLWGINSIFGWGKRVIEVGDNPPTGDVSLYAQWKKSDKTVMTVESNSDSLMAPKYEEVSQPIQASYERPELSISEYNLPSDMAVGFNFGIRGIISTSAGTITSINGYILDSNGYAVQSCNFTPYESRHDIRYSVNNSLIFGRLPAGTYTYRVNATATNGDQNVSATLIQGNFSVYDATPQSVTYDVPILTISEYNLPSELDLGSNFGIHGIVNTNCGRITSIQAYILDENYVPVQSCGFSPNESSHNLRYSVNNELIFGRLGAGTYTYRVDASAVNGDQTESATLINTSFTVKSATPAPVSYVRPVLTISEYNLPSDQELGVNFGIRGIIRTSCGRITKVQAYILDSNYSPVQSCEYSPNESSLDLRYSVNNDLVFGRLPAGAYTYRVDVTAVNGDQSASETLIHTAFTVTAPALAGVQIPIDVQTLVDAQAPVDVQTPVEQIPAEAQAPVEEPAPVIETYAKPDISIQNASYPSDLTVGQRFAVTGVIAVSEGFLSEVKGYILNSAGEWQAYSVFNPETAVFDISSTIGAEVSFDTLPEGYYVYRLVADAENGDQTVSKTLVESYFYVNPAQSAYAPVQEPAPEPEPAYEAIAESQPEPVYEKAPVEGYRLASKLNSNYVLDIANGDVNNGGNLQLSQNNNSASQGFYINVQSNGYYRIISSNSGLDLTADGTGISGSNVYQWEYIGSDTQLWAFIPDIDGSYFIVNKANGCYLDVDNACANTGTNVKIFDRNDGYAAQNWFIQEVYLN